MCENKNITVRREGTKLCLKKKVTRKESDATTRALKEQFSKLRVSEIKSDKKFHQFTDAKEACEELIKRIDTELNNFFRLSVVKNNIRGVLVQMPLASDKCPYSTAIKKHARPLKALLVINDHGKFLRKLKREFENLKASYEEAKYQGLS